MCTDRQTDLLIATVCCLLIAGPAAEYQRTVVIVHVFNVLFVYKT